MNLRAPRNSSSGSPWLLLVAFVSLMLSVPAQAQQGSCDRPADSPVAGERIALVIGAADYDADGAIIGGTRAVVRGYLSDLANPLNDAREISAKLCRLQFRVTTVTNPTRAALQRAVEQFGNRVARTPDAVALVYFSGHALQVNGENWLLPIGARLPADGSALPASESARARLMNEVAVSLRSILSALPEPEEGANIIILDACRNNPWDGRVNSPDLSSGTVLAAQPPPSRVGSIIIYSTASGAAAADGTPGGNSPFTTALLAYMDEPGELGDVLRKVRRDVFTAEQQAPWELGSLLTPFCFTTCGPRLAATDLGEAECDTANQTSQQVVYFDWDKRFPGVPGRLALDEAAVAYGESGAQCVSLIYPNMADENETRDMQHARAQWVREYLLQRGVPRDRIVLRELIGVRRRTPGARRVEIRFSRMTSDRPPSATTQSTIN